MSDLMQDAYRKIAGAQDAVWGMSSNEARSFSVNMLGLVSSMLKEDLDSGALSIEAVNKRVDSLLAGWIEDA